MDKITTSADLVKQKAESIKNKIKCGKCKLEMTKGEPYMHYIEEGYYNVPSNVYYCSNQKCKNWCKIIRL